VPFATRPFLTGLVRKVDKQQAIPRTQKQEEHSEIVTTSDSLAICLFGFRWERDKNNTNKDEIASATSGKETRLRKIGKMFQLEYEEEIRKQAVMNVCFLSVILSW
jgi:hypothetical protein